MKDDDLLEKIRARRHSLGLPQGEGMGVRVSNTDLLNKIHAQRASLKETVDAMAGTRGIFQDVIRAIVPIFEEQLDIMEETVQYASQNDE